MAERVFYRKLKEFPIEINPARGRVMLVLWQNDGVWHEGFSPGDIEAFETCLRRILDNLTDFEAGNK